MGEFYSSIIIGEFFDLNMMINSITDSVSIFHNIHMNEYNFQTGCVRGKNYYGGKGYYIAVFPLGGKDYYIAIFQGGESYYGGKTTI